MGWKEVDSALNGVLRLQSYPIGVKTLKKGEVLDKAFARPAKYNVQVSLCQWVTMARRWNRPLSAFGEDVNCSACLASLGLKTMNTPDALAEYCMDMGYFDEMGLAEKAVSAMEVIEPGLAHGYAMFPLGQASLEPDLVVIYGTPAQMSRLAAGYAYATGTYLESVTGFGISCLSMMKPIWSGKPALVVPGRGERLLAGTDENEMFAAIPAGGMEALMKGLAETQKRGNQYPVKKFMIYQPPSLPPMQSLDKKMS